MVGLLQLEILKDGEPTFCVPEYAELEIRLTNHSPEKLADITVKVGNNLIKSGLSLRPAASWSLPYNVSDLAGELEFIATSSTVTSEPITIIVTPQKISLDELLFIKTERLPTLLTFLDAPNRIKLVYNDDSEKLFDFISLDYTAERLDYFSRALLESKLSAAILNHLDYATPVQNQSGAGLIQGALDWPATLRDWFNRPELTGYLHHWQTHPKFYGTLPNLLFIRLHLELAQELEQLIKLAAAIRPRSPRLEARLPQLKQRAEAHRKPIKNLQLAEFVMVSNFPLPKTDVIRSFSAVSNPAYIRLGQLWQEFITHYVKLPDKNEAYSSLQPTSKIYELWAVCEIAAALQLKYKQYETNATAFYFEGETEWGQTKLYYNRALQHGWFSAARTGLPRPDINLEILGENPRRLLLDVKYRVMNTPNGKSRAKPEDMYKMLAYMNDLNTRVGGIIYPGEAEQIEALAIAENQMAGGQRLIELALRPLIHNPTEFPRILHDKLLKALDG